MQLVTEISAISDDIITPLDSETSADNMSCFVNLWSSDNIIRDNHLLVQIIRDMKDYDKSNKIIRVRNTNSHRNVVFHIVNMNWCILKSFLPKGNGRIIDM